MINCGPDFVALACGRLNCHFEAPSELNGNRRLTFAASCYISFMATRKFRLVIVFGLALLRPGACAWAHHLREAERFFECQVAFS